MQKSRPFLQSLSTFRGKRSSLFLGKSESVSSTLSLIPPWLGRAWASRCCYTCGLYWHLDLGVRLDSLPLLKVPTLYEASPDTIEEGVYFIITGWWWKFRFPTQPFLTLLLQRWEWVILYLLQPGKGESLGFPLVCAHWHFQIVGLLAYKSGIYEASRKTKNLTAVLFFGSRGPLASLFPSLHFSSLYLSDADIEQMKISYISEAYWTILVVLTIFKLMVLDFGGRRSHILKIIVLSLPFQHLYLTSFSGHCLVQHHWCSIE